MFTTLVTYLGDDVVVLHTEGCESTVGSREFQGKSYKFVEVDTVDEEKEDVLVWKFTVGVHDMSLYNKNKDFSDFTNTKIKQHNSVPLLKFVSNLHCTVKPKRH